MQINKLFLTSFKIQHNGVHAIALISRRGAIVKNMAEVRAASAAQHFGARHSKRVIGFIQGAVLSDGFKKTGPSASACKF